MLGTDRVARLAGRLPGFYLIRSQAAAHQGDRQHRLSWR